MDKVIEKYKDMVYRIAFSYCRNRSDADDVFQEVFLRYFRKAPVFKNAEHEKAWLIRVTVNCSKSVLMSPWRKHGKVKEKPKISQIPLTYFSCRHIMEP